MTTLESLAANQENPTTATGQDNINANRWIWIWGLVLILVNLPLIRGDIRTEFIFFPDAVIHGQWWRILTYPLVHLSWYHLMLDAGGFLLVFHCLEEDRPLTRMFYIAGACCGSLGLALALDSAALDHGLSGLSGVAHGLMAVSALEMLARPGQKTWGAASLAIVTAKCAYELWSGHVFFEFMHLGMCGHPLAASHAGGVAGGAMAYLLLRLWRHLDRTGVPERRVDS